MRNDKVLQLLDNAGKNFAALLKEIHPSLALIDGLYGMEDKGPIKGSPVFHGFAIASEDIVLVDSLTTYIMGFEVDQVPYIAFAYKEGLGNNRWQNIVGVEPSQVKFPYRPHPFFQKQRMWKNHHFKQGNREDRGDRTDRKDRDPRDRNSINKDYRENRDKNYKDREFRNKDKGFRDRKDYREYRNPRDIKETRDKEINNNTSYNRSQYQKDKD